MSGVGMARAFARGRTRVAEINARNASAQTADNKTIDNRPEAAAPKSHVPMVNGPIVSAQRLFNLPISARTVLVDLQTVRAARGVDAESIVALVDNGELQWVFDLGLGGGDIRELRFWAREIIAPETVTNLKLSAVVDSILGNGATIRRGEIERQWVISAPHVMRLVRAEEIKEIAPGKICRLSLVKFLTSRHAATAKK